MERAKERQIFIEGKSKIVVNSLLKETERERYNKREANSLWIEREGKRCRKYFCISYYILYMKLMYVEKSRGMI